MHDRTEWGRQAFVAAHGRFQEALADPDPLPLWAALGETLFWIYALDDIYRHGPRGDDYTVFRDADPYGQVISGLGLPRNGVAHTLAMIVIDKPNGADIDWQPRFAPHHEYGLTHSHSQRLPAFERNQARPIRYQLRDANYFFVRRQRLLARFQTADSS